MSLITQCPACNTMFRVVPDQLRVSDGWVRCGQCDEVFDANLHLQQEVTEDADADADADAPASVDAPRVDQALGSEPAPDDSYAGTESDISAMPLEPQDPFLHKSPHELAGSAFAIKLDALDDLTWDAKSDLSLSAPELDTAANVAQPRYVQAAAPLANEQVADALSFMRPAPVMPRRNVFVRSGWWMAAVLLVAGLALQGMRHERDALSAHVPASRSALDLLCSFTGCVVAPWRKIESLVIDSSSFVKVQTGVYRLNFTIKNNSDTAVALPAVELTLTDLQDQAVIRRVVSASEAGAKQAELSGGAEWSASVPLALKTATGSEKVTGYRILVFYP